MPPAADQHGASLEALCADLAANSHVIVASNRGPVGFSDRGDGTTAVKADGGQVSGGLAPLRNLLPLTWISAAATGGDRAAAAGAEDGLFTRGLPPDWAARLITPSRRAYHRFYNTVCNPLLWFLHHRSWGFTHTPNIDHEAHAAWEQGFVAVSGAFAAEIAAEAARAGRPVAVLLRDYHMHLAGGMVRELLPDAAVHYAVDVPWPGPADWLMLPERWRTVIFKSLLSCDVVGFTSAVDVRSFLAGVEEFVPGVVVDREAGSVASENGHELQVRSYPPPVDHASLLAAAGSHRTGTLERRLEMPGLHTFVTAERAEPHKNIVRCVRAYGALLDRDPSLADRTRYLLVLAPPPPHLSQYRRHVREIEQAVGEVNSRRRRQTERGDGPVGPVELHIENNYPLALASMLVADTLVAAPIADAMCSTALATPLVNRRDSSLIVSETSSAAEVFRGAAAIVSPADVEALGAEMARAVERSGRERRELFARAEAAVLGLADGLSITRQVSDLLSAAARRRR